MSLAAGLPQPCSAPEEVKATYSDPILIPSLFFPGFPTVLIQYLRGVGQRRVVRRDDGSVCVLTKAKEEAAVVARRSAARRGGPLRYCLTLDPVYKSTTVLATLRANGFVELIDGQLPGQVTAASLKDQIFAARKAMADGTEVSKAARVKNLVQFGLPHASVLWSRLVPDALFAQGLWWQRLNHFPGRHQLGHKDTLAELMGVMRSRHPRRYEFCPECHVLRGALADAPVLRVALEASGQDGMWIRKPFAESCGRGISVFPAREAAKVLSDVVAGDAATFCVVQQYISNPLLIDGVKFDLRVYVLVLSFDPLVVYIYDDGIAKFCTAKFDLSASSTREAHLANQALNKHSPNFIVSADEGAGSRWTHRALWDHLCEHRGKVAVLEARAQLDALVVKTFAATVPHVVAETARLKCGGGGGGGSVRRCFEVFGLDVALDENLVPHLLEVNVCPELRVQVKDLMSVRVIGRVVADVFHVIGLRPPPTPPPPTPMEHLAGSMGMGGGSAGASSPASSIGEKDGEAAENAQEAKLTKMRLMLKMGIARPAVLSKMVILGLDPALLDQDPATKPFAPAAAASTSTPRTSTLVADPRLVEKLCGPAAAAAIADVKPDAQELLQLFDLADQHERSAATLWRRVYPCASTMASFWDIIAGEDGAATLDKLPRKQMLMAQWVQAVNREE